MIDGRFNRGLPIGGHWVPVSGRLPVINPATGTLLAEAPLGGVEHLEMAVAAAAAAREKIQSQAAYERAEQLLSVAREIGQRRDEFSQCILAESGKPILLAEAEVSRAIVTFTAAAEEARRPQGETLALDSFPSGRGHTGFTRRFPIGTVYGITPFNFPLNLVAHKVAPCLAVGNAILVKPAPKAPLTSLLLAEALEAAGVPAGQVSVVICSNQDAAHLVGDPRVALTSFTGSPDVGWRMKERCGRQKLLLELGGNAAVVVHEDADLQAAIGGIITGGFGYAGQSCISVQRVFVHEPIYARFRERLLDQIPRLAIAGDPADRRTLVGPLIDHASLDRVLAWIGRAVDAGASVLIGGRARGLILEPTVLEGVSADMDLWTKEVFAPVILLQPYTHFEEALSRVNDSVFGLQAGVFTADLRRAFQAFERLEVGGVMINEVPTFRVETMPYGGIKLSGLGREGIRYAMEEMTELRSMVMNWR